MQVSITPGCVFVLVAVPERIQFPAEMRVPAAEAKARIAIPERRPQFEQRILEERRPVTQTHVNDDWFVLLDVGLKESGISLPVWVCWFADEPLASQHFAPCLQDTLTSLGHRWQTHIHHHSRTSDCAVLRRLKK